MAGTSETIIVAGSGRSGTTWLGNIIAGDEIRILFEPFDFRKVPEVNGLGLRPYFDPDGLYREWDPIVERILLGHIENQWIDQDRDRLDPFKNKGKILLKEIRVNGMLGWISNQFGCSIVYIIRHPCAVISSRIRQKWLPDLREFYSQPEFCGKFLQNKLSVVTEAVTEVQKHTLMWCLENIVPLSQCTKYKWHFVTYESLVGNPDGEIEKILDYLKLDFNGFRQEEIKKSSRTNWNNSNSDISSWTSFFTEKELLDIQSILSLFDINLYNVYDAMPLIKSDVLNV